MKYRKKPVVVETFRLGIDCIPDWFMDKVTSNEAILHRVPFDESRANNYGQLWCEIKTLEGVMKADEGDYIIKGVKGEIYPCKPDIFEKTYELVDKTVPNKLTDSEIVKALECLEKDTNCGDCAVIKQCKGDCVFTKCLDLINRLQAQVKKCEKVEHFADKTIATLQAENERLKPFEDKIAEFNSHIRVEDMLVFANSLEEWLEFCDNLKAEAYKEFAERLKERADKLKHISIDGKWAISQYDVDNLLKELVGEGDA